MFPGMMSIRLLTSVSHDTIYLFLVERFQWNLTHIFIMWVGIAGKVFKVSCQRSRSQSRLIAVMAEAYVLMLWHRGSLSNVLFFGDFWVCLLHVQRDSLGVLLMGSCNGRSAASVCVPVELRPLCGAVDSLSADRRRG